MRISNVFSVDVEDYYQVGAFARIISPVEWDNYESRVVDNTLRILDMLDRCKVKATFFVLGWIASRSPDLVGKIAAAGHEIASHGTSHQMVYTQSEEEFREDVRAAREILRAQSSQEVLAYRAPSFTITTRTPWAHRILAEEGYRYDSSVFPIHHDLHGNPDAPTDIHRIETEAGSLVEFPPAIVKFLGQNIPSGGGGYFRLFPYGLSLRMLRSINARKKPFIFYIHPWELDPGQPRIGGAPLKSRFRHYINLKSTEKKLKRLLNDFHFTTLGDVLSEWEKNERK